MKRPTLIIAVLAALLAASHVGFEKWEADLRKPYHFVFEASKAEWPSLVTSPIPDTDISEVNIAGSFNAWGSRDSLDALLEGQSGWRMKKTGPGRWELTTPVPIPVGSDFHQYKFRVKTKGFDDYIWLRDAANPVKADDSFGSYNSIIRIRTVADVGVLGQSVLGFALILVLLTPILRFGIHRILRLPFPFVAKVSILTLVGALLISALSIAVTSWTAYRVYLQRDSEMANFILDLFCKDFAAAIREDRPLPDDWKKVMSSEDELQKKLRANHSFRSGLSSVHLYSAGGQMVGLYPSITDVSYWYVHEATSNQMYRDLRSREFKDYLNLFDEAGYWIPSSRIRGWEALKIVAETARAMLNAMVDPKAPDPFYRFHYPIRTSQGKLAGHMMLNFGGGASGQTTRADLARLMLTRIFAIFLVAILVIVLASLIFGNFLLDPVQKLMRGFAQVQSGDFSVSVDLQTRDELQTMGETFNSMLDGLRAKQQLLHYVSKSAWESAHKRAEIGKDSLQGESKTVTLLFSDIKGFTAMSGRYMAKEVVEILNAYFDEMTKIIARHNGQIDKFIGDAIMAVYEGDPTDSCARAVRSAIEMQNFLKGRILAGKELLQIRIGINTGQVIMGDIGSLESRRDYTCIGDQVNKTQRLESLCSAGGVLLSVESYQLVSAHVQAEKKGGLMAKGFSDPITAYEIKEMIWRG